MIDNPHLGEEKMWTLLKNKSNKQQRINSDGIYCQAAYGLETEAL